MPLITSEMAIGMALKKAHLTPDVVPSNFYPEAMLDIKYGDQQVTLGNDLSAQTIATAPQITVIPPGQYTLLMIDANTKSCHWATLPGTTDPPLVAYNTPDPSSGATGPFTFLLYKRSEQHGLNKNTFNAQQVMEHEPLVGVNFFNIKKEDT